MKTPTDYDIEQLMHRYDAAQSHAYYMRVRKLKGRKKGFSQVPTGRTRRQIHTDAKAKQRKELATAVHNMENKLKKLEELIKKAEHSEASEDRKGTAKKERAAKENDKPKSAAEKAELARGNEKFRKKNQQKLKTKAKTADPTGGGSSKSKTKGASSKHQVANLKSLATKVRGQIQVAKQKLAAL